MVMHNSWYFCTYLFYLINVFLFFTAKHPKWPYIQGLDIIEGGGVVGIVGHQVQPNLFSA